ncbi:MobF family relaxase [Rhizobium sp. RU36D]|uniref:MobF family relaxase n=1 Tax=Rhizobium sp. RU36D TaxID=1907415 RepID=UPI0009D88346|nr:MobF family relaxase [Rhizobium sp. RU36D]SMD16421.1 conjugative relaxase domain-containing protein, TrwC/TraI family [Rhizobium sp. RU36D]
MVAKSKRISDFSYFVDRNEESKKEAEAGLTARINESVAYYAKSDKVSGREAVGVYWVPKGSTPLFSNVKHGEVAQTFHVMKNADGIDPETGACVRHKNNAKKTSKGYDLMMAPPKEISVMIGQSESVAINASGNEAKFGRDLSDKLQAILKVANDRAMQFAFDEGLFEVRVTEPDPVTGENVTVRMKAADISGVQWMHFSSREGDPQVHFHNVVYNSGRKPDGSTGTIDNNRLMKNIYSVNAVFNAEVIRGLAELGLTVTKDKHNYKVDGFVKELLTTFSKRSEKVLEVLKDEYGKDGRSEATAALMQAIVLKTRNSKSELPPLEQLIKRWGLEAKAEGHNLFSLLEGMKSAAELKKEKQAAEWAQKVAEAKEQGIDLPAERPRFDMDEIRDRAFASLTDNSATFEERQLNAAILEELSMFCGADEALGLLDELKNSDKIVEVGMVGRERVFSTPYIVELERSLMNMTMEMLRDPSAPAGVPYDIVADILVKGAVSSATGEAFVYRADQAEVIEYFAGDDQIAIAKGPPGAGKSAAMEGYVKTERAVGRRVFGVAPTNRASIVLKDDAHIEAEHTRSVFGFIHDVQSGRTTLGPNDVVLCDEFGMVGLEEGEKLMALVKAAGARFRGLGDDDQIQPVPFGATMRSMMHVVDYRIMTEISRQKTVPWMLEASKALVRKDVAKAIDIYNQAGCITLALSYEDMIDRTVARHFKVTGEHPGKSHVIIARTNAEVREINDRIRDGKIERGELASQSVKLAAMSRGQDPYETEIELSAGDRIILGDNIKIGSDKLPNNSFGTVRETRPGVDGGEAWLKIEFENGFIWEGVPSDLTNQYNETSVDKDTGKRIPHIALAYAMTIYAAQGMTCDYSTMVNSVGMGIQTSLVGMTRQRLGFELICDASRIHDKIAARGGSEVSMAKDTGATKEDDPEPDAEISDEEVRKELIKEMEQDEAKKNVSDFQADPVAWAMTVSKEDNKVVSKVENETKAHTENKVETKVEAQATPAIGRSRVRGLGQFGAKVEPKADAQTNNKTAGDILQQRMQERATSSDRREMPKPNRPMPGTQKAAAARIQAQAEFKQRLQDESDKMVKEDLRDYMLRNGASYSKDMKNPELGRNASGRFAGGTEYSLTFGKGQGCVVSQAKTGHWGFFMRDGSAKGDIRHFVMWRDGGDFKSACETLRDELDLRDKTLPRSSYSKETKVEETRIQRHERLLAEREATAKAEPSKFQQMKEWLQSSTVGKSVYAMKRGITEFTQQKLGWFHNEPKGRGPMPTQNPGGIMFPMSDHQGELTGLGRKGPPTPITKGKSFFFAADGSEKHLWRAGEMTDPKVIYTGEAALDVAALYQKQGHPEKAMVTATLGNMGDSIEADYYELAKKHPDAKWVWAGQNDEVNARGIRPADVIQEKAFQAIRDGNPNAEITAYHPEVAKDWAEQVQKEMEATRTREQIDAVWTETVPGNNGYLRRQGVSPETQFAFQQDMHLEQKGIDGKNAGGVIFALRDRDNFMTGFARYGDEIDASTSLPFRKVESLDSRGGMIRMGNEKAPSVFYSGQHAVEVMQAFEKDGRPENAALLIAELGVDRKLTKEQSLILKQAAEQHPEAKWNFVQEGTLLKDQREAVLVEQAAAHMRMAIREGNPNAEIEERVSASMLQTVKVQEIEAQMNSQLEMSQDKSKDTSEDKSAEFRVEEQEAQQQERRDPTNQQQPEQAPKSEPAPAREPEPQPQPDPVAEVSAPVVPDASEEERRRRGYDLSM